jgi:hypothetical protein
MVPVRRGTGSAADRTSEIAVEHRALNHRSIASTTAYVRVPDERLREALRA